MSDINKLYANLKEDGYQLGTESEFVNNLKVPEKARKFYENLKADGYNLGEWEEFQSKTGIAYPAMKPDQPTDKIPGFATREEPLSNQQSKNVIYGDAPSSTKIGDETLNTAGVDYLMNKKFNVKPQQEVQKNINVKSPVLDELPQTVIPTSYDTDPSKEQKVYGWYNKYIQAINQGASSAVAGGASFMENLSKQEKELFDVPIIRDYFGGTEKVFGAVKDYFNNDANKSNVIAQVEAGKDFTDFWKEGRYMDAAQSVYLEATKSLPLSLATVGSTMAGMPGVGLSMMYASSTGNQIDQLKGRTDMSEAEKQINAHLTGIIEAGSELIGDVPIGNMLKQLYNTGGEALVKKTIKSNMTNWMSGIFSKSKLLAPIVMEGIEEAAGQIGQNAVSYATGETDSLDLMKDVGKSFVYGAAGGSQFSAVAAPKMIKNKVQQKQVEKKVNQFVSNADTQAEKIVPNWNEVKTEIQSLDKQGRRTVLENTLKDQTIPDNTKKSISDYIIGLDYLDKVKERWQEQTEANVAINYEDGSNLYLKSIGKPNSGSIYAINNKVNEYEAKLGEEFASMSDEQVIDYLDNTDLTEEQSNDIENYLSIRSNLNGAIQAMNSKAQSEIDQIHAEIDSTTRKDGTRLVVTTPEVNNEPSQTLYVIDGNIALDENGNVVRSASDTTLVAKNEQGETVELTVNDIATASYQNAQEAKNKIADDIFNRYAQQFSHEAETNPTDVKKEEGATITWYENGKPHQGIVIDKADGFVRIQEGKKIILKAEAELNEQLKNPTVIYHREDKIPMILDGEQYEGEITSDADEQGKYTVNVPGHPGKINYELTADEITALHPDNQIAPAEEEITPSTDESTPVEEITPEQQAEQQAEQEKQKFIETLPKIKTGNKAGRVDTKKLTPEQAFQYTKIMEGTETAVKDIKDDIFSIDTNIRELNKKLQTTQGTAKIDIREDIRELNEQRAGLKTILDREAPGLEAEMKAQAEKKAQIEAEVKAKNEAIAEAQKNRVLTDAEKEGLHNNIVSLMKEHNEIPPSYTQKRRAIFNEINKKSSMLGYSVNVEPGGHFIVKDKEGKPIRTIAQRTPQEEIDAHPLLTEYAPEFQAFALKLMQSMPETLDFPNTNVEKAVKDILAGTKTVAANRMLDGMNEMFSNNEIIIRATAFTPEVVISIEEYFALFQAESKPEQQLINTIPDEILNEMLGDGEMTDEISNYLNDLYNETYNQINGRTEEESTTESADRNAEESISGEKGTADQQQGEVNTPINYKNGDTVTTEEVDVTNESIPELYRGKVIAVKSKSNLSESEIKEAVSKGYVKPLYLTDRTTETGWYSFQGEDGAIIINKSGDEIYFQAKDKRSGSDKIIANTIAHSFAIDDYASKIKPEINSTTQPIKNGDTVTYKGKQYTVNGIYADNKEVDLEDENGNLMHEEVPVSELSQSDNKDTKAEKERARQEERKQRILSEGTSFDKKFGLIPVSEIKSAAEIQANIEKIIATLKANEGNKKFDSFEGFAYGGKYAKNAGEQIREYFNSIDVLPLDIRKEFAESIGVTTPDELVKWGEKKYNELNQSEQPAEKQSPGNKLTEQAKNSPENPIVLDTDTKIEGIVSEYDKVKGSKGGMLYFRVGDRNIIAERKYVIANNQVKSKYIHIYWVDDLNTRSKIYKQWDEKKDGKFTETTNPEINSFIREQKQAEANPEIKNEIPVSEDGLYQIREVKVKKNDGSIVTMFAVPTANSKGLGDKFNDLFDTIEEAIQGAKENRAEQQRDEERDRQYEEEKRLEAEAKAAKAKANDGKTPAQIMQEAREKSIIDKWGKEVDRRLADGYEFKVVDEVDKAAEKKREDHIAYLNKVAPWGNEKHPQTIELNQLKADVKAGKRLTKKSYRLDKNGVFIEVPKTVLDYYTSKTPEQTKPKETVKEEELETPKSIEDMAKEAVEKDAGYKQIADVTTKYGWTTETDGANVKLINGKGKHVATVIPKGGSYVINDTEGTKLMSGGRFVSNGVEKVIKEYFYGKEVDPQKPAEKPAPKNENPKITKLQEEADAALNDFLDAFNDLNSDNLGIVDNTAEKQAKMLVAGTKMVGAYTKLGVYKFADLVSKLAEKGIQITEDLLSAIKKAYGAFAAENDIDELDDMKTVRKFTLNDLSENKPEDLTQEEDNSPKNVVSLSSKEIYIESIKSKLANGEKIKNTPELVKMAQEAGYDINNIKNLYDIASMSLNQYIYDNKENFNPEGKTAEEALQIVARLNELSNLLPTETQRSATQVELQQYSTPPAFAFLVNWAAGVNSKDHVLEPSAGEGNIAIFAKNTGAKVYVNEWDADRRDLLSQIGFDVVTKLDAKLIHVSSALKDKAVTTVVMNPPFSKDVAMGGKMDLHAAEKHIEGALQKLVDEGRLVAIVGRGMSFDSPTHKAWWDKIKKQYHVRANVLVSGDAYTKKGTSFDNRILVIDKTGETFQNEQILTGEAKSYEELTNLLTQLPQKPRLSYSKYDGNSIRNSKDENGKSGGNSQPSLFDAPSANADGVQPGNNGQPNNVNGDKGRYGAGNIAPDGLQRPGSTKSPDTKPARQGISDAANKPGANGERPKTSSDSGTPANKDEGKLGLDDNANQKVEPLKVTRNKKTEVSITGGYADYVPEITIEGSKPHPTKLVESTAMSSVSLPSTNYSPTLPISTIESGAISSAQIEDVILAGNAHRQILPNGERRGFFLGAGTGYGKGRTIAAIIFDNWNKGKKKAVWVSKNEKAHYDSPDYWKAVGGDPSKLFSQKNSKNKIAQTEGVLMMTYDTLKSSFDANANNSENPKFWKEQHTNRMQQIAQWLGKDFDGVIIFDESHEMANGIAQKGTRGVKKASLKALAGIEFQRLLPKAKIVYSSATGATEVSNFTYAQRLGLWGDGTPFNGAAGFISAVESSGVAGMEIIAKDLKAMGVYTAKALSFDGVVHRSLEHKIFPEQKVLYDKLARAWQLIYKNIEDAIEINNTSSQAKSAAKSAFWGGQQRFFSQIIMTMEMPTVIQDIQRKLDDGNAVVIQLVNTNEAQQNRALAEAKAEAEEGAEIDYETLDMSPKSGMLQMLLRSFPVGLFTERTDENGNIIKVPVMDEDGHQVQNPEAVRMRDKLIADLDRELTLPESPLDMILNTFGIDNVAEITGRSKRVVQVMNENGEFVKREEKRTPSHALQDKDDFMDGKKNILVFSDAGGTGASFHADLSKKNQKQRSHYLLQAGWRADKAVQGLGRSHRANQRVAPEIILPSTDLKSQKRFISSIARRLEQLGALTKGQRDTANQGMFGEMDNLEGEYAKQALFEFYIDVENGRVRGVDMDTLERQMVIQIYKEENGVRKYNTDVCTNTKLFLNHIMSLEVDLMDKVFNGFIERLEEQINTAKENGSYDEGIQQVHALHIKVADETEIYTDEKTGAKTFLTNMELEIPNTKTDYESLLISVEHYGDKFKGFYREKNSGKVYGIVSLNGMNADGSSYQTVKRISVVTSSIVEPADFRGKYEKVPADEAELLWNKEYTEYPNTRKKTETIVKGLILPIWNRLPDKISVKRYVDDNGKAHLGRYFYGRDVRSIIENFGVSSGTYTAEDVKKILKDGGTVKLSNGFVLSKTKYQSLSVIQIGGTVSAWRDRDRLERAGVMFNVKSSMAMTGDFYINMADAETVLPEIIRLYNAPVVSAEDNNGNPVMANKNSNMFQIVSSDSEQLLPSTAIDEQKYNDAKTLNEKYEAGKAIIEEVEKLFGTEASVIVRDNNELVEAINSVNYTPGLDESARKFKLGGVFAHGIVFINTQWRETVDELHRTWLHENVHKSTKTVTTRTELRDMYEALTDSERKLGEEYDNQSDFVKHDEVLSHTAERLLDFYTIEDIANGNIDLSLFPEVMQPVLFKVLNHLTNGKLENNNSVRQGQPRYGTNDTGTIRSMERNAKGRLGEPQLLSDTQQADGISGEEIELSNPVRRLDKAYEAKEYEEKKEVPIRKALIDNNIPVPSDVWKDADKIYEPKRTIYNDNNIGVSLYKRGISEIKFIHSRYGHLLRFDSSDKAPQINKDYASRFRDLINPAIDRYVGMLQQVKHLSTPAAQQSINELIEDARISKDYYDRYANGENVWSSENDPRYQAEQAEMARIKSKAQADGTFMKAPNGKPTNLNERQWLQVRTENFKKWFGDWQNDPKNASKVVDANGEPMVVYHATDADYDVFEPNRSDIGIHFGTSKQADNLAVRKSITRNATELYKDGMSVLPIYARILNPIRLKDYGRFQSYDVLSQLKDLGIIDKNDPLYKRLQSTGRKTLDDVTEFLLSKGYDGIVYINKYEDSDSEQDSFIALQPNQIKSATGNNGDFSTTNPDINFQIIGEQGAYNLDKAEEATTRMDNLQVAKEMEGGKIDVLAKKLLIAQNYSDAAKQVDIYPEDLHYKQINKIFDKYDDMRKIKDDLYWEKSKYIIDAAKTADKQGVEVFLSEDEKGNDVVYFEMPFGQVSFHIQGDSWINKLPKSVKIENHKWNGEKNTGKLLRDNLSKQFTPQEIRLATGWERGADGKFRYETSKHTVHYQLQEFLNKTPDGFSKWYTARLNHKLNVNLIDIFGKEDETLKALPQLRNIPVKFASDADMNGAAGDYDPETKSIRLNVRIKADKDKIFSVLEHEVQHAIQDIEGFAKGGNTSMFEKEAIPQRTKEKWASLIAELVGEKDENGNVYTYETAAKEYYNDAKAELIDINNPMKGDYSVDDYKALDEIANSTDIENVVKSLIDSSVQHKETAEQKYKRLAGEVEARNAAIRKDYTPEQRRNTLLSETADVAPEDQIIIFDGLGVSMSMSEDEIQDKADKIKKNGLKSTIKDYTKFLSDVLQDCPKRNYIEKQASELGWDLQKAIEDYMATFAVKGTSKAEMERVMKLLGLEDFSRGEVKMILWDNANPNDGTPEWIAKRAMAYNNAKDNSIPKFPTSAQLAEYNEQIGNLKLKGMEKAKNFVFRFEESYMNQLASMRVFMDIVGKDGEVPDKYNPYYLSQLRTSAAQTSLDRYEKKEYKSLMEAVSSLNKELKKSKGLVYLNKDYKSEKGTIDAATLYSLAKAGLGRNERLAREEAEATYKEVYTALEAKHTDGKLTDEEYEKKKASIDKKRDEKAKQLNETNDYGGLTGLSDLVGSGAMDFEDVRKVVEDIVAEAEKAVNTDEFWKTVKKATSYSLKYQYDRGMMTKQMYEHVLNLEPHYLPLRGYDEETAGDLFEYFTQHKGNFNPVLKKATGHAHLPENPFAHLLSMTASGIMQAENNKVKLALLNLVENNKNDIISIKETWIRNIGTEEYPEWVEAYPKIPVDATSEEVLQALEDFETQMQTLKQEGRATIKHKNLQLGLPIGKGVKSEHAITVKRNGQEQTLYVNGNPRLAQAINGMLNPDTQDMSKVLKFIRSINRGMSANFTSRNLEFAITNTMRDIHMAAMLSAIEEGLGYSTKLIKNIAICQRTLASNLFGSGTKGKYQDYLNEYLENGGQTGFVVLRTIENYNKDVEKLQRQINKKDALAVPKWIFKQIGDINNMAEQITRFATYVTSREAGRTPVRSAIDAKNITLNFNQKGSGEMGAGWMQSLFLFFNPAMQALYRANQARQKHPARFWTVMGLHGAAGAMIPALTFVMMALIAGDDDDELEKYKQAYWNTPEWIRRNNLMIWIPGTTSFVKYPLGQELRWAYSIGEIGLTKAMGQEKYGSSIGKQALESVSALLPVDILGASHWYMPGFATPLYESKINENFMGKPIYKETPFNTNDPEWTKAYKNTWKPFVSVSKKINEIAGGDDVSKGKIDINPAISQHLVEGYLGGMVSVYLMGAEQIGKVLSGEEISMNDIPIARRVYSVSDNQYYDNSLRREYFDIYNDLKKGVDHKLQKYNKIVNEYDRRYNKNHETLTNEELERWGLYLDKLNTLKQTKDYYKLMEYKQAEKAKKQWEKEGTPYDEANLIKQVVDNVKLIDEAEAAKRVKAEKEAKAEEEQTED